MHTGNLELGPAGGGTSNSCFVTHKPRPTRPSDPPPPRDNRLKDTHERQGESEGGEELAEYLNHRVVEGGGRQKDGEMQKGEMAPKPAWSPFTWTSVD